MVDKLSTLNNTVDMSTFDVRKKYDPTLSLKISLCVMAHKPDKDGFAAKMTEGKKISLCILRKQGKKRKSSTKKMPAGFQVEGTKTSACLYIKSEEFRSRLKKHLAIQKKDSTISRERIEQQRYLDVQQKRVGIPGTHAKKPIVAISPDGEKYGFECTSDFVEWRMHEFDERFFEAQINSVLSKKSPSCRGWTFFYAKIEGEEDE